MKKLELGLLILLLLGAFVVRLYRFNGPVADWHSWRQADTSAVSRHFAEDGFDLLHPRIDNISNVQTNGQYENPNGYFFAEFPLYNAAQAGLFVLFGHFTLEEWGRLVSILCSLVAMVFMYLLVKKYANKTAGFFAVFFYAFFPFAIYYSRTILPDSTMNATLFASIYFFDLFLSGSFVKKYVFFFLSLILLAIAILVRPYAVFYGVVYLYLVWKKWGFRFFLQWQLYIFALLSLLPFALWRVWMLRYPEGIPVNGWLFNGGNIRFSGAFFYWIFGERIGKLILGYWGTLLLGIGIFIKKRQGLLIAFFAGSLLYLTVVARGNVQHDYYQLITIPSIAMLCGLGASFLMHPPEYINTYASRIILFVSVAFTLAFGWYYVRDFFDINNPSIIIAGQVADKVLPKDAKVITFFDGDSTFLYQIHRQGWASLEKSLPEMIAMGANYVVIANPTPNDFSGFGKQYAIVAQSPQYLIVNLNKPTSKNK